MESYSTRAVHPCRFLILLLCVSGEPRYVSDETTPWIDGKTPTNCSSSEMTVDHLKAVANDIKCAENNDKEFWELACKCAVSNLPESECPKCRVSRNAVSGGDDGGGENLQTTFFPATTTKSTTEDGEPMSKRLRLFNSTTVSNSVNFIRFGK